MQPAQTDIDDGLLVLQQDLIVMFGLTTAAVFGRVQAYCRLADGVCRASQQTIADKLGLNRSTVNRALLRLVEAGYLVDLTPDLVRHPHQYQDTGKAGLKISIEGYSGVALRNTSPESATSGVASCNTSKNGKKSGVASCNTTNGENRSGVALCNTRGSGVALDNTINVVVVNPLNTEEEEKQQQELSLALRGLGIKAARANELARTYTRERIELAVDVYTWARHFKVAHHQGWLIRFLTEDWAPPDDYIPAGERCSECWQSVHEHDPGCTQRYTSGSIICPYCQQYPCACEEEEYLDEPAGVLTG